MDQNGVRSCSFLHLRRVKRRGSEGSAVKAQIIRSIQERELFGLCPSYEDELSAQGRVKGGPELQGEASVLV